MATPKGFGLTEALLDYVLAHGGAPPDETQQRLIERTKEKTGAQAVMQIALEIGPLLTFLTRLAGGRRAIEIGTFTGYSSIAIARGLASDGQLICLDVSEEWTAIAREAWDEAGLADRIELRLGPAAESLRAIPAEPVFDLAFIDADKTGYAGYVEALHPRLRPSGLIVVDNVLWGGSVVDAENQEESTRAIRSFNDAIASDERFDRVMLQVGDGLTLLRKR